MSWLFFIINIIGICFEAAIANIFYTALSTRKYFNRFYTFLFYLIFIIIRSSAYFFAKDTFSNIVVTLITMTLLSLLYKFSKIKQAISILILCVVGILTEYAVGFLLSFILNLTVGEIINSAIFYTVGLLVSKLVLFGGVKFFAAKYKARNVIVVNKFLIMFIIFPIITFFVGVVLIGGIGVHLNDNITIIGSLAMVLLVGANIFVFYLFDLYASQIKTHYEISIHKEQLLREKEYLSEIIDKQTQGSKKMHDLKNQLFAIRLILEKDNLAGISKIDEICNAVLTKENIQYTNNCSIDALINSKVQRMNEANIDFSCHSYVSGYDGIDNLDLCVIIGNIIDNAIESCCKTICNRKIKMELSQQANYININIENTCMEKLVIKNNEILTSKYNKYMHGFGLKNVNELAKKYNGYFEITNENGVFMSNVMLTKSS